MCTCFRCWFWILCISKTLTENDKRCKLFQFQYFLYTIAKNKKIPNFIDFGCSIFFFFVILKQINVAPGGDIRPMYEKVPFFLEFRVRLFNVTNKEEILEGSEWFLKFRAIISLPKWKKNNFNIFSKFRKAEASRNWFVLLIFIQCFHLKRNVNQTFKNLFFFFAGGFLAKRTVFFWVSVKLLFRFLSN